METTRDDLLLAERTEAGGTVWQRIADDLAAAIGRGDYPPGAALPTALALAERYGVHRHTVRQAFRSLQDLGLISVARGRGTFVREKRLPYRLGRHVSLRGNLAAQGVRVRGEVTGCSRRTATAEESTLLAVAPAQLVWSVFTRSFAGDLPISLAEHVVPVQRFPAFDRAIVEGAGSFTAAARAEGIATYQRLSTRLRARAASDDEQHALLLQDDGTILESIGLDGDADGKPFHIARSRFAGERVEIVVEPER